MIRYNPDSLDRFFIHCIHQARITAMYKRLGSERNGVFVTVGFSRRESEKNIPYCRQKVNSDFFNFNNVINKIL